MYVVTGARDLSRAGLSRGRSEYTGANCLDEFKVADPEILGGRANFLAAGRGGDFSGGKWCGIALITANEIPLLLPLFLVDWRLTEVAAVGAKQTMRSVGVVEMLLEFGGSHPCGFDKMRAMPRNNAGGLL